MTEIENIKESCIRNKAFGIVDVIEKLEQENLNLKESLKHIQYLNELKYKDYEKRMSDNATIIVNLHNQIKKMKCPSCVWRDEKLLYPTTDEAEYIICDDCKNFSKWELAE